VFRAVCHRSPARSELQGVLGAVRRGLDEHDYHDALRDALTRNGLAVGGDWSGDDDDD
jgi:hypothetical protein